MARCVEKCCVSVIAVRLIVCKGFHVNGQQERLILRKDGAQRTGGIDGSWSDRGRRHSSLMIGGDVRASVPVLALPAGLIRQQLPLLKGHGEVLTPYWHSRSPCARSS